MHDFDLKSYAIQKEYLVENEKKNQQTSKT